ncbi:hypothetical protein MD484_g9023, partial [Candolleomyces efflorescens]
MSTLAFILPTAPLVTGGGLVLAQHECGQCKSSHPNPAVLAHANVPPEVVERVVHQLDNPLDIHRLSALCHKFKALAIYVIYGRLLLLLENFGIGDPTEFLRLIRRQGFYWAGPALLPVLFPNLHFPVYEDRMELHVHHASLAISSMAQFLRTAGYRVDGVHATPAAVQTYATETLNYPQFGLTVKRIVRFVKNVDDVEKEIVIFISQSETTGFLSIAEYPTTLFMIYVDGINVNILYLWLTGNSRGLINLAPCRQHPPPPTPHFVQVLSPFFDLKPRLADWPEYRFHFCDHNVNCPLRLRHQLDNRTVSLGCSLDHPDMHAYRQRSPPRAFPSFPLLQPQIRTLCIWRLRCCGSCVVNMPFPAQDLSHRGVYIASDMYIVEPRFRR